MRDQAASAALTREDLAPYTRASRVLALQDLLTSVVGYFAMATAVVLGLHHGHWAVLVLTPLSAVFLLRSFIVFHDCCHGSFWPTRRGNQLIGHASGLLVVTPFVRWRHDHAVHHATAGDLDHRGIGDVPTMTVGEYQAATPKQQRIYRITRNPIVMLTLGPIIGMIIGPRLVARDAPVRMVKSVLLTDFAIVLAFAAMIWWLGPVAVVLAWLPPALLAGSAGVWLFYVQHQYEDAYWRRSDEWTLTDAALAGSSFLSLPPTLRFATGNIGYHHVHHLSVRIPNYRLRSAHEELEDFRSVPVLTIGSGVRAMRLKLWHESEGRLVTFAQARASSAAGLAAVQDPATA